MDRYGSSIKFSDRMSQTIGIYALVSKKNDKKKNIYKYIYNIYTYMKKRKKKREKIEKKIKATCCSPMFRSVQRIIEVAGWKFSGKCNRKRGYNCECRIACPDQYFFVVPDKGSWQSRENRIDENMCVMIKRSINCISFVRKKIIPCMLNRWFKNSFWDVLRILRFFFFIS